MTSTHEAEVASRFDQLHGRFKHSIGRDDYRLRGIVEGLGRVEGLRILDLGCGKGRFARALEELGATVLGMDLSSAMLSEAAGLDVVRATARRIPFREGAFDAAIAVEVFEHIDPRARSTAIDQAARVLRSGGRLVIVDKNVAALDALRPWLPAVAVKRIDESRGRWMYPAGGPVRECWFRTGVLKAELRRGFGDVRVVHLLSPAEEARRLFRRLPAVRLMTMWVATAQGGHHV
jgi:ubiquinone/menaquinone biosynthesis C-methylase UbiE